MITAEDAKVRVVLLIVRVADIGNFGQCFSSVNHNVVAVFNAILSGIPLGVEGQELNAQMLKRLQKSTMPPRTKNLRNVRVLNDPSLFQVWRVRQWIAETLRHTTILRYILLIGGRICEITNENLQNRNEKQWKPHIAHSQSLCTCLHCHLCQSTS
jgi:hypothetical protein